MPASAADRDRVTGGSGVMPALLGASARIVSGGSDPEDEARQAVRDICPHATSRGRESC